MNKEINNITVITSSFCLYTFKDINSTSKASIGIHFIGETKYNDFAKSISMQDLDLLDKGYHTNNTAGLFAIYELLKIIDINDNIDIKTDSYYSSNVLNKNYNRIGNLKILEIIDNLISKRIGKTTIKWFKLNKSNKDSLIPYKLANNCFSENEKKEIIKFTNFIEKKKEEKKELKEKFQSNLKRKFDIPKEDKEKFKELFKKEAEIDDIKEPFTKIQKKNHTINEFFIKKINLIEDDNENYNNSIKSQISTLFENLSEENKNKTIEFIKNINK